MQNYHTFCCLTLLLLSACSPVEKGAVEPSQPNVLIILTDDLGYGDISAYGQENYTTPHIDSLAAQGVLLTDFYVPTPYCAPSRASLITGRFPLQHGLIRNPTPDAGINDIGIPEEEVTLGEVLQETGYATKCIGKWHLGHKEKFFPVNHGFDEYFGILYSNDMRPVQLIQDKDTVEYPVDQRLLTRRYTEKAVDFIAKNQDQPFFLHLCHAMPHKPLAASERFYTPETPNDLYADVIKELDWSVGQLMGALDSLQLLENTIVIFMSDNGPWYGGSTGGLKGMKANTWEGGIRVPFIIRYPRVFDQNQKINTPCWSLDIFPTLLSLTGAVPSNSNPIQGEDITDILTGDKTEHGTIYSMRDDQVVTMRRGDWKLFVREPRYYQPRDLSNWSDPRGPDGTTILAPIKGQPTPAHYPGLKPQKLDREIQLFNLRADPTESRDLSQENPDRVKQLLKEYEAFQEGL